jgi:hypothetical protein
MSLRGHQATVAGQLQSTVGPANSAIRADHFSLPHSGHPLTGPLSSGVRNRRRVEASENSLLSFVLLVAHR